MTGIYKLMSPSGKVYIGSSINISKRILYYKYLNCQGQVKLYNSLLKYGYENHIFEILELCTMENLYERERYYGELYDVLSDNGLNLILPKNGEEKKGVSEETKVKMSLSKIGTLNTFFGKTHSTSTRDKLRRAQTGRKHTTEHRMKVSKNSAKSNSKLVINTDTGIFYDSIKDASLAHGYVHSTLKQRLGGHLINNTSFIKI